MKEKVVSTEDRLQDLFLQAFKEKPQRVEPLRADGSNRRYFRLVGSRRTAIGAMGPDAKENAAFLGFSKHFRARGLPVPEIYAEDRERGVYLEEDLGDTTLFELLNAQRTRTGFAEPVTALYEKVARLLPKFQIEAGRTLDYSICYPRESFDRKSMMWDLNHFKYYFLTLSQVPFDEQSLEEDFERFADFLTQADSGFFLYRDFQSRNVMVRQGAPYFIDYQGGRKGALQYDIASLLYDAKADIPTELRGRLLECYLDAASELAPIDRKTFLGHYHGFVFIRIMQALGAYGLRGFYERKVHFLKSIPYAIRNLEYLQRTVELPVKLPSLMEVFRRMIGSSYLRQFSDARLRLTVSVSSFSYRSGMPADDRGHGGGFVFDCRPLPNPGRQQRYADLKGGDQEVIDFLDREPDVQRFLDNVYRIIDPAVENYQGRNFTDLMAAFGCTGGRHRSVYCAERLVEHLRSTFDVDVEVRHLGLGADAPARKQG